MRPIFGVILIAAAGLGAYLYNTGKLIAFKNAFLEGGTW